MGGPGSGEFLKIEKDPKFKEWLKNENIDYAKIAGKHKGGIRKRFENFIKYEGSIGIRELAEHTPFSYNTLREMIGLKDRKIEKQMPYKMKSKIKNAHRVVAELEKADVLPIEVKAIRKGKEWRYKPLKSKKRLKL